MILLALQRGSYRRIALPCQGLSPLSRLPLKDQAPHMHAGADTIGELVYIPVFDQAVPSHEVQAVIEVVLARNAPDHMAVANVITFIGGFLGQLQVSSLSLC